MRRNNGLSHYEKVPTLVEKKNRSPHPVRKAPAAQMTLLVKTVLAPEAIFDWNDNI
jgi:hypothetical protein